jgi:hypothetical protein
VSDDEDLQEIAVPDARDPISKALQAPQSVLGRNKGRPLNDLAGSLMKAYGVPFVDAVCRGGVLTRLPSSPVPNERSYRFTKLWRNKA